MTCLHLTTRGYSWPDSANNNSDCRSIPLYLMVLQGSLHIFLRAYQRILRRFFSVDQGKILQNCGWIVTRLQQQVVV